MAAKSGINRTQKTAYEPIKRRLKARIESGELVEGARVPSEHELAKQYGVSRNQSRQALRELELEGYLIRRRGSGSYVAPLDGRITAIRPADSGTVAMIFPQYLSRYSREVIEGFMQHMSDAGRQTITYNWQRDKAAEVRLLRTISDSGVAGFVAWIEHDNAETRALVQELRNRAFPVVLVDRHLEGVETDYVLSNNEAIGYRLTKALIDAGHRRIAFAGIHDNPPSSIRNRLRGYRRALDEAGIAWDERLVGGDQNRLREGLTAATGAFMAFANRPTGFVCVHDGVAKLLYDGLLELGYRVPQDVVLAAVNDDHPPERPEMPMLKIGQRAHELGERSAAALLERIADPDGATRKDVIDPLPLTGLMTETENATAAS